MTVTSIPNWQRNIGRAQATFVTLVFLFSGGMKLGHVSKAVEELTHAGIPEAAILPIGILELTCLALYLYPRTSILGAFALSAYLGGAILTHIVSHQPFFAPLIVGMFMFTSAWLRHAELRKLVPFRTASAAEQSYKPGWRTETARS